MGKNRKSSTSGSHETNFNALFWRHLLDQIVSSFEVVLLGSSPTNGWRVKGALSKKILSFVITEIGVLWLPDTYIFLKNIKFYMISRSAGQITSLYVTVWRWAPNNFLENLSKESIT